MLPSHGCAGTHSARGSGISTSVEFVYVTQKSIFKMAGWGSRVKRHVSACKELITIINSYCAKGTHIPLWELKGWRS